MPFDGPLLAIGAVQALAALPAAIKNLQRFIESGRLSEEAAGRVGDVLVHLRALAGVHTSLGESKRIHDRLHHLDTELEEIRAAYSHAISEGRFVRERYQLPQVRLAWEGLRRDSLSALISDAASVVHLETRPVVLGASGWPEDGPPWLMLLLERATSITSGFREFDSGDVPITPLVDQLDSFSSQVKQLMEHADRRIIQEYDELRERLKDLSGALSNV